MNEFNIVVGKRIRELRENRGYTRERLAEIAEMSSKFLYEVETGRKGLSAQKMFELSCALDISMDFITSGEQKDDDYVVISFPCTKNTAKLVKLTLP